MADTFSIKFFRRHYGDVKVPDLIQEGADLATLEKLAAERLIEYFHQGRRPDHLRRQNAVIVDQAGRRLAWYQMTMALTAAKLPGETFDA